MTKEEAKKILEESEELAPWTDDEGVLWHYKVGGFVKKYPEGNSFAVYPYSAHKPVDPKYAFQYIVFDDNGDVDGATMPMTEEEFKMMEMPAFIPWLNDYTDEAADQAEILGIGIWEARGLRADAPQDIKDAFEKYLKEEKEKDEYFRNNKTEARPK